LSADPTIPTIRVIARRTYIGAMAGVAPATIDREEWPIAPPLDSVRLIAIDFREHGCNDQQKYPWYPPASS
jgi:hypothetical protein